MRPVNLVRIVWFGAIVTVLVNMALAVDAAAQEPPYVDVKLVDDLGYELPDVDRLIIRESPAPVVRKFRGLFVGPTLNCASGCNHCEHGERSHQWSISPTDGTRIIQIIGTSDVQTTEIEFSAHGQFTITFSVGALPEGECPEGLEHTGNHGGATNSTDIRIWELQSPLTASNPAPIRGDQVATSSVLLGGVNPITTFTLNGQTYYPYNWKAEQVNVTGWTPAELHGSNTSWPGRLVASTTVRCTVNVQNPYAQNPNQEFSTDVATVAIQVQPRQGWHMPAPGTPVEDLQWQNSETQFPEKRADENYYFIAYGENTNNHDKYQEYAEITVFPVYGDNFYFPEDYEAFDGVASLVTTGPNMGLWYNINSALYKCDRKVRFNHWATPGAGKPSVPSDYNGYNYTNWLGLQIHHYGDTCTCSNPSLHGGVGGNARWRGSYNHETYGPPGSPNQRKLGHQAQIEDVFVSNPLGTDAVYKCEDNVAATKDALRINDEVERSAASHVIWEAGISVDAVTSPDPAWHSFYGYMLFWVEPQGDDPYWDSGVALK
ncbi:MAG: hypothetical protein HY706_14315 [Candidatus Hydrogenedentes bacterium]|nr:hypothetical protein [Candidatus Hydrogenedentota bacterium]